MRWPRRASLDSSATRDRVESKLLCPRSQAAAAGGAPAGMRAPTDPQVFEWTASPSRLERSGQHEMRVRAVTWCRTHPVQAAALPGWNLELLAKILEGVR